MRSKNKIPVIPPKYQPFVPDLYPETTPPINKVNKVSGSKNHSIEASVIDVKCKSRDNSKLIPNKIQMMVIKPENIGPQRDI